MLHLFSRLCRGRHLLAPIIIKDPITHAAIPNGSLFKWRGLPLYARPPPKQKGFQVLNRKTGKYEIGRNKSKSAKMLAECFTTLERVGKQSQKKQRVNDKNCNNI